MPGASISNRDGRFVAGPSSGSHPPFRDEELCEISVDAPSTELPESTLPIPVSKPRPLNLADDFEILGGVPAFVWRAPQNYYTNYRVYAISCDDTRIAIKEDSHRICVYDMLDNFKLLAEWEDKSFERIDNFTFHNYQNNELVVVFDNSIVALMHITIESEDATKESNSSQPPSRTMKIKEQFSAFDCYKDIKQLDFFIANEGYETWVIAVDYNIENVITLLSIKLEGHRKLQIYSKDYIMPTRTYCSISKKTLLLVHSDINENKVFRTRVIHDISFTNKIMEDTSKIIEYGQSFGYSECGQYFLIWRNVKSGEDALEVYEAQTLKISPNHFAKKSLGPGVLTVRGVFIKSNIATIKMLGMGVQDVPIVAFLVAYVDRIELAFWNTSNNEILKEMNLPIRKMKCDNPFHIEFCISPNAKWVAVGCYTNGTFCMFSVLTKMQVWSIRLATSDKLVNTIIPLKFNVSSTGLIINAHNTLCVFCPPCLIENYQLEFQSTKYDLSKDNREQQKTLKTHPQLLIPKHMLKKMLVLKYEEENIFIKSLLDVAISRKTSTCAFLFEIRGELWVIQGPLEIIDREIFQSNITSWNEFDEAREELSFLKICEGAISNLQKLLEMRLVWIFLYEDKEKDKDSSVVFWSQSGFHGSFIDFGNATQQVIINLGDEEPFLVKQSKDGNKLSCLLHFGVRVIDLKQRTILNTILYLINLAQWLNSYIRVRKESFLDVGNDGKTISIGWDKKNKKLLALTFQTNEEECKALFREDSDTTPCCFFQEDFKTFTFLEFKEDNQTISSICIYNVEGNSLKRIDQALWNPHMKRVLNSIHMQNLHEYNLHFDESNGHLWIMALQQSNNNAYLIFLPINPYSLNACIPCLYVRDYPMLEINELNELSSQLGPPFFNMTFNGKTNFRLAYENKDKALMTKLLNNSNQHGLSLNDVLVGSFEEDFSNNFLKLATKNKNEAGVAFFFDLLEKGSLPFDQGASMLKSEFSNLWMHYRSMLEPRIMNNCLQRRICDIEVPIEVVSGSWSIETRMGTINSIADWEHAVNQGIVTTYYKSLHREALEHIAKKGSNVTTTAMVVVFTIASMCKIGLNGIIRPLLMQEAPSHVFGTSLLKGVLNFKWEKIWKKCSWKSLCFYLVYMLIYSVYSIWITLSRRHISHNVVLKVCLSVLLFTLMVFASILLYQEYIQMKTYIRDGKKLFPNDRLWGLRKYWSSGWNIVEVVSYIMVIMVISSLHFANLLNLDVWSILSACIAVESILIWIKVWYFAQAFEKTGAFVLMIENIIKDCVPFLSLALVILLGFSFALFILFQRALHEKKSIDNEDDYNETRDMIEQSFGDPWKAIVTMFYAMIGTFEPKIYCDSGSLSILITILFVMYLAIQMIVMVNMLVAIMGDTFDRVKSTEEEQLLMGRARFIDACEAQLSESNIQSIEDSIGEYLHVLYPKDEDAYNESKLWQGRVKTIEDKVAKMIKESEKRMTKRMEEKLDEIKKDTNEIKQMLQNQSVSDE